MKSFVSELHVLTTGDVSRLLGVTPRTVRRWAADGTLPAPVRKGSRYTRWRASEIQRFLIEHSSSGPVPAATPAMQSFLLLLAEKLAQTPPPPEEEAGHA